MPEGPNESMCGNLKIIYGEVWILSCRRRRTRMRMRVWSVTISDSSPFTLLNLFKSQDVDETDPPPTDPSESRQFSQVISGLQKSYPREKMEEISTSFCFICLLHLANEQGLKLESEQAALDTIIPDNEDEGYPLDTAEKRVGNIWDIKVDLFISFLKCH